MNILDKKLKDGKMPSPNEVFNFIFEFSKKNWYFPTVQEIAKGLKIKSHQTHYYLPILTAAGLIEKVNYYTFKLSKNARRNGH